MGTKCIMGIGGKNVVAMRMRVELSKDSISLDLHKRELLRFAIKGEC